MGPSEGVWIRWYHSYPIGAVAQLGRAPRSQRGGQGFKSPQLHGNLEGSIAWRILWILVVWHDRWVLVELASSHEPDEIGFLAV